MKVDEETINKLYQYATALTNHNERAFDLVHDALINARNKIIINKTAYLKRSIRNNYYDQYNYEKKHVSTDHNKDYNKDCSGDLFNDFEDVFINQELIFDLLKFLSVEERELLFLVYVEDYSYEECSKITGLKIGTVMSKLNRAKEKARRFNEK